jgi:hypothetical protein
MKKPDPKKPSPKRARMLTVRMSKAEREMLRELAKGDGITASEWLRRRVANEFSAKD